MNIDWIRHTNKHELGQVEKYGYVVVGDSAQRAREIAWLLEQVTALEAIIERTKNVPKMWKCPECEYVHIGPAAHPGRCPNDEALMAAVSWEELSLSEREFTKRLLSERDNLERRLQGLEDAQIKFVKMAAEIPEVLKEDFDAALDVLIAAGRETTA